MSSKFRSQPGGECCGGTSTLLLLRHTECAGAEVSRLWGIGAEDLRGLQGVGMLVLCFRRFCALGFGPLQSFTLTEYPPSLRATAEQLFLVMSSG